jgi:succinyl-diaminopimelate desuccinylase
MDTLDTITQWIKDNAHGMVDLQKTLTARPALAPESGGRGESEKCAALKEWLLKNGITELEQFDAPDSRVPGGVRPNLVATVRGKRAKRVWIMSHLDVVPEGERSLWRSDPWQAVEKDGLVIGRGTEDNQQAIVSSAFAALSFVKNGIAPEYTIKLLFVADEENGSTHGIRYLLKEHSLFEKDDIIIIPDGGDALGESIEVAEKNLLWLKITTRGAQAHGSMPNEGNNAFLAACDLALRLNDMEKYFGKVDELFSPPYSTFQPTKKEANIPNINTIPGEDVFYMDCRILPCYTLDDVRHELEKRIKEIERKYKARISYNEEQAVESPATAADAPVVKALKSAVKKIYGVDAKPVGIGGGTVGAYLRMAGFDAAVWSRLSDCAHQPNEFCKIENMTGDAQVFAAVFAPEAT